MTTMTDRLYHLLPELYRWRDESHDHTLQAFLSIIDQELGTLEADMEAMYDNWFIQTCDDWVVPYLAGLLGVRNVAQSERMPFTQRRRVANTLAYRRRKGTIAVLEQIAWDVTNWHVSAREGYQLVAVTRHGHHPAAARRGLIDLRRDAVAGVDDPLSPVLHTVDVRVPRLAGDVAPSVADAEAPRTLPARYGMANVTLSFWRLRSYPMRRSPACVVGQSAGAPIYTFTPDGRDQPLFTVPQSFRSITQRAERVNLPAPLRRRTLDADLRAYRTAHLVDGRPKASVLPANSEYYGPDRSFNIVVKDAAGKDMTLAPWQISVGNLSQAVVIPSADGLHAVVDPETGRLALFGDISTYANDTPHVLVDYAYGFGGDIGGGAYPRRYTPDRAAGPLCEIDVVAGCATSQVTNDLTGGVLTAESLSAALGLWAAYCESLADNPDVKPRGLIRILDNGRYPLAGTSRDSIATVDAIWLPAGGELAIVADNGVQPTIGRAPGPGSKDGETAVRVVFTDPRRVSLLAAATPALVLPEAMPERVVDRALYLGGLRLLGRLVFGEGDAAINTLDVRCEDCALLGGIEATDPVTAHTMGLALVRCISGPLHLGGELAGLTITDSIVDTALAPDTALYGLAIACEDAQLPGARPEIVIERSTMLGAVRLPAVERLDTVLFAERVQVADPRTGDVRFCYLPAGSQAPPAQGCLYEAAVPNGSEHCTGNVSRPIFTSRRYGWPGYAQLGAQTPALFQTVTGDGGEIGVFHDLYQAQRLANLNDVLERYLPVGFNAGVYFVT